MGLMENINLYLDKNVMVTLVSGEVITGMLNDVLGDSICVGEETLPAETVSDIRCHAVMDMDTYDRKAERLISEEGYLLSEEDLIREVGEDFAFGSKIVEYHCHLVYDPESRRICVRDMKAIRLSHAVKPELLEGRPFLYRMEDGPYFYATLKDGQLVTAQGEIPFDTGKITDITYCPEAGEDVTVIFHDGKEVSSTVSSATARGLVLADGYFGRIAYGDIRQLRYVAELNVRLNSNGQKVTYCGDYLFRHRYFRRDAMGVFKAGREASFAVGMNSRGLIAKDISLDLFGERKQGYAILSQYANNLGYGFVQDGYEDGAGTGTSYHLAEKDIGETEIDTHRFLYVVRIGYSQDKDFNYPSVKQIEFLERYNRNEYRSLTVDAHGQVTAVPYEEPEDLDSIIETGYAFLEKCLIRSKSGTAFVNKKFESGAHKHELYMSLSPVVAKFKGQPVDTTKYVYLVRYWVDKRMQAQEESQLCMYKMDILAAYRRDRAYTVDENGVVSEREDYQFASLTALLDNRVVVICKDTRRYLGFLHHNDVERECITLISEDHVKTKIEYSRIAEVLGLGVVNKYAPGYYGFIQVGSGVHFFDHNVYSSSEPKLQIGDEVCFRMEQETSGKLHARQVRPVMEEESVGYVIGETEDGYLQVVSEETYGQVPARQDNTALLRCLQPHLQFKNLQKQDYKVRLRKIWFTGGAPLVYGVEKHLGAVDKLNMGYVEQFWLDKAGKYSQGLIVPLEEGAEQEKVYFHSSQNMQVYSQIMSTKENPNKPDSFWLVSFQQKVDPTKKKPYALNMQFLRREPKAYFAALEAQQAEPQTGVVEPTVSTEELMQTLDPTKSIQNRIHVCLQQNNVEAARELLDRHVRENDTDPVLYQQQMHAILMKEYKLNHTQDVRLDWLDCIVKYRQFVDQTEQYGLRLDLLFKQATLLGEEGRKEEADKCLRAWKQLHGEFCAIYPNKKNNYRLLLAKVNSLLGEGGDEDELELDNEEDESLSGKAFHAYIEWRLDVADAETAAEGAQDLWVSAKAARQQTAEEDYVAAVKAAVDAEEARAISDHFHQTAQHFTFLRMQLAAAVGDDELESYFANSLKNSPFAGLFDDKKAAFAADAPVTACSRFTLDSVLLYANTELDIREWIARFMDDGLRKRYIQELSVLLGRKPEGIDRFDMEQVDTMFREAVAVFRQPVGTELSMSDYAEAVQSKLAQYRRCGISVSREVERVLRDLRGYDSRKGFTARMGCLRGNANKLQTYHQSIQNHPTVHDWNLVWPLCARLIGQIQRTWHQLCQIFVPSIEFGSPQAVREPDGTWRITVPLRNSKNAQQASNIRFIGFEADGKNSRDLYGNGKDYPFGIRVKPEDPETEQLMLDLKVGYQYVSDVRFSEDKYKYVEKKETVSKTVSVSCTASQRQELSLDILNSFGYDAKENIDMASSAGKVVAEILKNRADEIETVIGAVSTGEKGSRRLLRDGRWVALYGQWRVGKSLILHEVNRALRGEEFGDQAVPVYALFGAGEEFEANTVSNISNALDKVADRRIAELWMNALEEWEDRYGEVCTMRSLGRLIGRFHQQIAPKTIVLALDEFTAIYYAIKNGDTDVSFLRSFVDFIQQTGCVILTAGGEHTVRLMTDYDVNMLQKADCRLEVKYLSKEDTAKYVEAVITVPSYLGTGEQKERTQDRIFELTQGNAFLLHKFCEALVRYVRETKNLVRIDDITIQRTLDRIAGSEPDVISVYFNSLYNPYNESKDQQVSGFGGVRDLNLKILRGIVAHAFPDNHSCRKDDLSEAFEGEPRFEEFLKVLIDRTVVREDSGNLSVPIDLFYEILSRIEREEDTNEL